MFYMYPSFDYFTHNFILGGADPTQAELINWH